MLAIHSTIGIPFWLLPSIVHGQPYRYTHGHPYAYGRSKSFPGYLDGTAHMHMNKTLLWDGTYDQHMYHRVSETKHVQNTLTSFPEDLTS